jgi:hypothetical protein
MPLKPRYEIRVTPKENIKGSKLGTIQYLSGLFATISGELLKLLNN